MLLLGTLAVLWLVPAPHALAQAPTEEELKEIERQAEELEKKQAEAAAKAEAKRKGEAAKKAAAAAEAKRKAARKQAEERQAAEEAPSARPESDGRGRATEAESASALQNPRFEGARFGDIPERSPAHSEVEGVMVYEVKRASRAWLNGLREGDIVLPVNHIQVSDPKEFLGQVNRLQSALLLNVLRGNSASFIVAR